MTNQKPIDSPSYLFKFGWERIGVGDDLAVPVIVRSNDVRYSPVRIVEQEIIKRYENLPQSVFQCITLRSFYLTACEAKLLNDINFTHCNNRYGDSYFSTKDVMISAGDVKELSRYLNISYEIFTKDVTKLAPNMGIIRLTIDTGILLVPYIAKSYKGSPVRFVPSKLIELFVTISQTTVRGTPNDWDIMYLKMLCIYCENGVQNLITRDTQIVLLDGLLYSKTNTPIIYEDLKGPIQSSVWT